MVRLRPLLLTGGPAVGKTVTARALAEETPRTAYVDVDDVRQLVKNGAAPPWAGAEGQAQLMLGVTNAAGLARNFATADFNVTMTDVVTAETLRLYRRGLPRVLIVRLVVSFEEARRRARTRAVFLTSGEFQALHAAQQNPLDVDVQLEVTRMSQHQLLEEVRTHWNRNA